MSKFDLTHHAFKQFLEQFSQHAPDFIKALNPPASDEAREALPDLDGLHAIYNMHDGAFNASAPPSSATMLFRKTHFLPLQGKYGALSLKQSIHRDLPDIFPIASNFQGRLIVVWTTGDRRGQVYEIDPREGPKQVAPSLAAWLNLLSQQLEQGSWKPVNQQRRTGQVRFVVPLEIPQAKPFLVRMIGGHGVEFVRHRVARRDLKSILGALKLPYDANKLAQKSFLWAFSLHTPTAPLSVSFRWFDLDRTLHATEGMYTKKILNQVGEEMVYYTTSPEYPVEDLELEVVFEYYS